MPSSQVAAIILFWAQVVSGAAGAIFIAQFAFGQWKQVGKVDLTSLLSIHPRWVVGLMAFSLVAGIFGLWLTYRIPRPERPVACLPVSSKADPKPETIGPQSPSQSDTNQQASKQQHLNTKTQRTHASPKNPPMGGVAQDGNGNQQTVTQAPVSQANSGGCNQQVVGGNNNSNICAPPARTLTADQNSRLAAAADEIPKSIMVVIGSADDGESQSYAEEIRKIFVQHGTTRARGTLFGWHPKGVFIVVNPDDDASFAQKLGYEMDQFGFSIKQVDIDPNVKKGEIHILVGDQ